MAEDLLLELLPHLLILLSRLNLRLNSFLSNFSLLLSLFNQESLFFFASLASLESLVVTSNVNETV